MLIEKQVTNKDGWDYGQLQNTAKSNLIAANVQMVQKMIHDFEEHSICAVRSVGLDSKDRVILNVPQEYLKEHFALLKAELKEEMEKKR